MSVPVHILTRERHVAMRVVTADRLGSVSTAAGAPNPHRIFVPHQRSLQARILILLAGANGSGDHTFFSMPISLGADIVPADIRGAPGSKTAHGRFVGRRGVRCTPGRSAIGEHHQRACH